MSGATNINLKTKLGDLDHRNDNKPDPAWIAKYGDQFPELVSGVSAETGSKKKTQKGKSQSQEVKENDGTQKVSFIRANSEKCILMLTPIASMSIVVIDEARCVTETQVFWKSPRQLRM